MRFAGMGWHNAPYNWGEQPGANYSGKGFTHISFWARGDTGGETVDFRAGGIDTRGETVNFRSGGIDYNVRKYRDLFDARLGLITLTREWRQYHIDVSKADLSSVIRGFCWAANSYSNLGNSMTFFLRSMLFE